MINNQKKLDFKKIAIIIIVVLISFDANSIEPTFKPFGAIFGQKFNASQHKTMVLRGNVRTVKLKTTNRPDDTEEIIAEICDDYGLQVITWRSHIRSSSSAQVSHNDILKRLKKKFGTPKMKHNTAFWTSKELSIVVKIRNENRSHQNQIRYFGPQNQPCFKKFIAYLEKSK